MWAPGSYVATTERSRERLAARIGIERGAKLSRPTRTRTSGHQSAPSDDDYAAGLQKIDHLPEQTADMVRSDRPQFRAGACARSVPAERVDVPPSVAAMPRLGVGLEGPHEPLGQAPERRTASVAPAENLVHGLGARLRPSPSVIDNARPTGVGRSVCRGPPGSGLLRIPTGECLADYKRVPLNCDPTNGQ